MSHRSPWLIAECCQNHNGDIDLLWRMLDEAVSAGATHVKIQHIFADSLAFRPQFEEGLEVDGVVEAIKRPYAAEWQRLKGLEIDPAIVAEFVRRCEDAGVVPMTTCFAREHVSEIADLGFKAVKVASYDCGSFPMLRDLARAFETLVVSTGASFDDEIEMAADILTGKDTAFLHCVTIYPTPFDQLHLARMEYLKTYAERVGLSDHSLTARDGVAASKAALALGAEVIERHFTVLSADESRDGPVSINSAQLRELSDFAALPVAERVTHLDAERPDWRLAIGDRDRTLSTAEMLNRDYYRGRFASRRPESADGRAMIFNWEETPLP